MPGPAPKTASTRARRNKTSTAATIKPDPTLTAPELPDDFAWHSQTVAWWNDVWASPMAPEFDDSDKHGLIALAVLVNHFCTVPKPFSRMSIAAEIRQQSQRFGLSPIDRRRLQWEIERTEEAQEKGAKRRAAAPRAASSPRGASDPRTALHVV